jgi:hypothetical protein
MKEHGGTVAAVRKKASINPRSLPSLKQSNSPNPLCSLMYIPKIAARFIQLANNGRNLPQRNATLRKSKRRTLPNVASPTDLRSRSILYIDFLGTTVSY